MKVCPQKLFLNIIPVIIVMGSISCKKKDSSDNDSTPATSEVDGTSEETSGAGSGDPTTTENGTTETSTETTESVAVKKSANQVTIAGSLSLTSSSFGLSSKPLGLTVGSTIKCVDAIDNTVLDSGVSVGTDGSFTCNNIPQCYDETSCAEANPVQVKIFDESTDKLICLATAGTTGLICDVAGCFAAAQADIDDSLKQCLSSVNMVAASRVFQDSLNKALKLGQIPLDKYTLAQCIDMTTEQKFSAMKSMTRGTVVEVLFDSLTSQMKKEVTRCQASTEAVSADPIAVLKDLSTIGFSIILNGDEYQTDLSDANSPASILSKLATEVKNVKISIANGCDPAAVLDGTAGESCTQYANTFSEDTVKYKFTVSCSYTANNETATIERELNTANTDWADCAASYTHQEWGTLTSSGTTVGAKLTFPNINDPQGVHSNNRDGDGIPFEYEAFKFVLSSYPKLYSLKDIYEIFFTEANGLNFRMRAWIDDYNGNGQEYILYGDQQAVTFDGESRSTYIDQSYAPSLDQVFGFITNTTHSFNLDKIIQMKVHRPWNPTGQEFFYVSGKEVNNKNVPVTCDILDSNGDAVGLNIVPGVVVSCATTDETSAMKRYFIGSSSNRSFVRLISKNNGEEIRTSDGTPIFLQNINVSPGENMPTCESANTVSIFTYHKTGEHDNWLDGRPVKTVCFDFASIKNAAEFYIAHHKEITIGTNNWSTSVIGGEDANGDVQPMCVDATAMTSTDKVGCISEASGNFTSCTSSANCNCDWENNEYMREFTEITDPTDGSLTMASCDSISGSKYYLAHHWEPGARTSLSGLKVALVNGSDGQRLETRNTSFDPTVVTTYLSDAFDECKSSNWCWRKDDIQELADHTEIAINDSWMKRDLVRWYCNEHGDNSTIRNACQGLDLFRSITLNLAKFSNISSTASESKLLVYRNDSYFSHMQQPNPNYNKVFDYETFTFKYANYDPYCDDIDGNGICDFGSDTSDVYFSDIWRFNPAFALYAPIDGISGTTFDTDKSLFPAEPTDWSGDWWNSYINPVFQQIGGPSALGCSNDRTVKLSWDDMHFWEDNNWRDPQEDACGSTSGYYMVRNIVPNANTYFLEKPDFIQTLMRIGFGTLDNRSVSATEKRFDFVQAMAVFMIAMEVPPIIVSNTGSYSPFYPTIDGRTYRSSWVGYTPINYQGELTALINLFKSKQQ